jgi:glycosyltransferase involved in cell wall biosynthesis
MKINFILPFAGNKPIGGFKIVYEYANRLADKGHKISLIHPSYTFKESFFRDLQYFIRYHQRKIDKSYNPDKWFELNAYVDSLWIREVNNNNIPDADATIATAWRTAVCVDKLSSSKGKKFYFIQHYETWNGTEEEVNATWKLPLVKIVIAKWLKEIAGEMNEEAYYVPNAFNFSEFGLDNKIQNRPKNKIMMLYNELEFKGSKYGIEAFKMLKDEFPDLEVILFGVPSRPHDLPQWFRYYQKPTREKLRELYNEAAIFISPSLAEGFPLPPAESMMCGCALVCTDIGGHREYAIDNETAILFKPKFSDEIVSSVKRLFNNDNLRIQIAKNGNDFIKQFTWEKAVDGFQNILKKETQVEVTTY